MKNPTRLRLTVLRTNIDLYSHDLLPAYERSELDAVSLLDDATYSRLPSLVVTPGGLLKVVFENVADARMAFIFRGNDVVSRILYRAGREPESHVVTVKRAVATLKGFGLIAMVSE